MDKQVSNSTSSQLQKSLPIENWIDQYKYYLYKIQKYITLRANIAPIELYDIIREQYDKELEDDIHEEDLHQDILSELPYVVHWDKHGTGFLCKIKRIYNENGILYCTVEDGETSADYDIDFFYIEESQLIELAKIIMNEGE